MGVIKLDYRQMRDVSLDVQRQADQARQVIAALQRAAQRLQATWAGASREAFDSAYALFYKEIERTPLMLDQISAALARTADTIEQAEQQAAAQTKSAITADNA